MARRYFTVGEVNGLIPRLEKTFVQVFQLRAAMRGEEHKLERAGLRLSQEVLERDNARDPLAVKQAKLMFRAYYEALTEALSDIEAMGGEVKDLEMGLVDFLAKRDGEEILLCWRLGEARCEHWHAVDAGFRGRRPLDEPGDPAKKIAREPPGLD